MTKSYSTLKKRFVTYLRVSTDKQGVRGLGIQAQRNAVLDHLQRTGDDGRLLGEYVEVESGRRSDRPELLKAIDHARNSGATLLIAKLDRLSRDVHFLTGLEKAGVDFIACDLPNANRLTITILAAVAEHEREMISQRTKAALAVARERVRIEGQRAHPGVKRLGNPYGAKSLRGSGNGPAVSALKNKANQTAARLRAVLISLQAEGVTTFRGIADALNARGVLSPAGRSWHATSVARIERRLRERSKD